MGKDTREHTYLMKELYYPRLVQTLPMTEKVLFQYIGKYRDKNSAVLTSPYPDALAFNMHGEDIKILYKVCNIDPKEMAKDVARIELPGDALKKDSLNANNVLFILLIRYYLTKKDKSKLNAIILYFACMIYGVRFNIQFKPYGARKDVMRYTINNLTNKFKLKQLGSVEAWLLHTLVKSLATYTTKFDRFSDRDIDELISAFMTRIRSGVVNIRDEYGKAAKDKNVILESKEFLDETKVQIDQKTYTTEIESLAIEFTQEFFSTRPNTRRILFSAKATSIAIDELQVTIDKVFDNARVDEMNTFLQCLFTIYFESIDNSNVNTISVRNFKFVQVMDSIFRKGNSKDPNILKAKAILDKWLRAGSATYRKTTRQPTIAEYRRGVYMYFLLTIAGAG